MKYVHTLCTVAANGPDQVSVCTASTRERLKGRKLLLKATVTRPVLGIAVKYAAENTFHATVNESVSHRLTKSHRM